MNDFTRGKGDKGKSIISRLKIDKDNLIIETLGELDELNSLCGLVRASLKNREIQNILFNVQENLFIIQADIASLLYKKTNLSKLKFEKSKTEEIEQIIKKLEKNIPILKNFIIPGSNIESGWLDYLRTITRKIERTIVSLDKKRKLNSNILAYINRISSLFFVAARYAAKSKRINEKIPKYR